MSDTAVARFDGVTKVFGGTAVVDNVSFDVRPGRIVGLLGRNGAGKTTSLRMLLGLTPSDLGGRTTVFGMPYAELPHAERRVGVTMDCSGARRTGSPERAAVSSPPSAAPRLGVVGPRSALKVAQSSCGGVGSAHSVCAWAGRGGRGAQVVAG